MTTYQRAKTGTNFDRSWQMFDWLCPGPHPTSQSPVSHIFHQSVTFGYVTDSGDYTLVHAEVRSANASACRCRSAVFL